MSWRANVSSKGRALLMLFLFSDIGEADAPTRIRVGSHADIARTLAPAGDAGLTLRELIATGFGGTGEKPIALYQLPVNLTHVGDSQGEANHDSSVSAGTGGSDGGGDFTSERFYVEGFAFVGQAVARWRARATAFGDG
jgi:hypothetical protein